MPFKKVFRFIFFIALTSFNFVLGGLYFLFYSLYAIYKFYSYKIPIRTEKNYKKQTYTYKNNGSRDLKIDIWYPEKNRKNHPLVIFSHGGGWVSGFRNQPNNVSWCKYLASRGFAVASIDYSLGYFFSMDDILKDYSDAIAYLKKHAKAYNLDAQNMALMGLSAGGHLALMYASYYSYTENIAKMSGIKGVVAYYAPSQLKTIGAKDTPSHFAKYAIWTTLKGTLDDKEEDYEKFSPINYIGPQMCPTLLAHGEKDTVVPFFNSTALYDKLKAQKVFVKLLTHKKGDHCFDFQLKDIRTVYIIEETLRFLERSFSQNG